MISQDRYVKITSGVGGGAGVRTRQLVLRVVTTSAKLAPNELREFTNPEDVAKFFGDGSEEAKRATRYFGFISKSVTAPQMMSFVRWAKTATPPSVKAVDAPDSLAVLGAMSTGALRINVEGDKSYDVTGIDLTGAAGANYNTVANTITTKLGTISASSVISSSVMSFDASLNIFFWTGGNGTAKASFDVIGGASDIAASLKLSSSTAIVSRGVAAESAVEAISRTTEEDNNFGSFLFTYGSAVGDDGVGGVAPVDIAAWNKSKNNMYMFLVGVEQKWMTEAAMADPSSHVPEFKGYSGCAVTAVADGDLETFSEQIPGEILAATDYTSAGATQNYMFYEFPTRSATVTDNATKDWYDLNRFNYIGRTQTAGQKLEFYQVGVLGGGATDAVDMNTYANEMWLKDYLSAQFMSAFLSLPTIPANDIGQAMLISLLQAGCDQAKYNGVFSAGKAIDTIQQLYITRITGDKMAWHQVATIGYWFSVQFLSRVSKDGRTEWYAKYVLVYSKDDAIRAVEGQDVLI